MKKKLKMTSLEQIADGIYVNDTTRKIMPPPIELTRKTFQNTLPNAESEEIAAAFVYVSKENEQWVAMSYIRLYKQMRKHIRLTSARVAAKKGQEIPFEIKQDLKKRDFYHVFALDLKIAQNPMSILKEAVTICDVLDYKINEPILMLRQGIVTAIYEAQQQKPSII